MNKRLLLLLTIVGLCAFVAKRLSASPESAAAPGSVVAEAAAEAAAKSAAEPSGESAVPATAGTHAPDAAAGNGESHGNAESGSLVEAHGQEGEAHGEEEEMKWGLKIEYWAIINLLILGGIAVALLKNKTGAFFTGRAGEIKAQLAEAQTAKSDAEGRLRELQTKMDALSGEVETLRAGAAKDAERLRAQILKEAEEDAVRLKQQAREEIAAAEREARMRLQAAAAAEAAKLAGLLAPASLQDGDHERLLAGLTETITES